MIPVMIPAFVAGAKFHICVALHSSAAAKSRCQDLNLSPMPSRGIPIHLVATWNHEKSCRPNGLSRLSNRRHDKRITAPQLCKAPRWEAANFFGPVSTYKV
jgi:hypothetical protein